MSARSRRFQSPRGDAENKVKYVIDRERKRGLLREKMCLMMGKFFISLFWKYPAEKGRGGGCAACGGNDHRFVSNRDPTLYACTQHVCGGGGGGQYPIRDGGGGERKKNRNEKRGGFVFQVSPLSICFYGRGTTTHGEIQSFGSGALSKRKRMVIRMDVMQQVLWWLFLQAVARAGSKLEKIFSVETLAVFPKTCSVRVAFFVTPLSRVPIFLDVRKEEGGIGRGIFLGAHKFHLQVFPSLHLKGKMHRTDRKQRSFLGVGLSGLSFGGPSIVTDPKAFRMEGIQWAWLPPPYCTNLRKLFLLSSPLKGIELSYLQLQIPRAEGGREKGSNWRLVERAIRETN